jgi:phospholipase C
MGLSKDIPMTSRRAFFRKAAAAAGGARLAGLLIPTLKRASAIDPQPGSAYLDAEHVVILMQENRSFDHCFGRLRGVRGFNDPRAVTLPNGNPVWRQTDAAGETYGPFRLNIKETNATWLGSLPHSWTDQTDARNHGNHDRWLDVKRSSKVECADMPLTLGYYEREDIPFYYALADAFTICDQHFCSSLTGTTPNRLYLWTGTVREHAGAPPCVRNSEVDYDSPARWKTFPERLEDAGVSWKIYQNELSLPSGLDKDREAWLANFTDNPIEFFEQYRVRERGGRLAGAARPLHEKAFTTNKGDRTYRELETLRYRDGAVRREMRIPKGDVFHQFRADSKAGQLPRVSWLVAPENFSDHPSAPWYGAWYVAEALDILTRDAELWKKTIFILTYDENDGYFDHMAPFVAPDPENAESGKTSPGIEPETDYLTREQDAARGAEHPRGGPIGLGYRVPMIVASPWSRGGYVCSQVFDHTSVLRLLENLASRWTGSPIRETNISTWRRTVCGDLSSAFRVFEDGNQAPVFPSRTAFLESVHNARFKPMPKGYAKSAMPRQEPGVRPSTALPYRLYAEGAVSADGARFEIALESRAVGAPFHAYTHGLFRKKAELRTRAYTVAADGRLADSWAMEGFENGAYDLHICGPNGFYRGFAGNATDPPVDIQCEYVAGDAELRASSRGGAYALLIADMAYGSGESTLEVAAGGSASLVLSLAKNHRWYDFSVKVAGAPAFLRRFAGRVETGERGFSDPAMA